MLRSGQKRSLENKSWAINLCCTGARQPLVRAHTPRCIPFFKAAVLLHASNVALPVGTSGSCLQRTRESVFRGPLSSRCSSHNTTIQKLAASTETKWAAGSFVTQEVRQRGYLLLCQSCIHIGGRKHTPIAVPCLSCVTQWKVQCFSTRYCIQHAHYTWSVFTQCKCVWLCGCI